MLRHSHLLQVMHRLALLGALLMAIAPVLSRWSLADASTHSVRQLAELCTSHGMQQVELGTGAPPMQAAHAMSMDMAMPGMDHGHTGAMPMDKDDGMLCDYCVLAATLLALLLVVLVLPLLLHAAVRLPLLRRMQRIASAWPAHGARGPPDTLPA
ncbi:DUF2946 family protein [Xanthomonas sp. A1809]|uniref:DUF2946 family protein n=1 Tax=Xanthomonas sp. A1809 TaxID=2821275 RepID=UPI001ADA6A90|nr:DUF2946 family protein [Xanthomonas sp. A1809]MBO9855121.1 DUF2946 family protein [Xanthomonas sp. A1809]